MSDLTSIEKRVLERELGMSDGYVLNFTDQSFADFFQDFGVEINNPKYSANGTSKAKRMRSFWQIDDNTLVLQALEIIVKHWQELQRYNSSSLAPSTAFIQILQRLREQKQVAKKVEIANSGISRDNERVFMEEAISQARLCKSELGRISPKVGAVIVKDGLIVASAYRGEVNPGEHAEFTLLEKKLKHEILTGSTLFTTLEPCIARNPPKIPCADRIIERRIGRVVIGILDPNPKITGRGFRQLQGHGIEVGIFDHDLANVIEELNREFTREQETTQSH